MIEHSTHTSFPVYTCKYESLAVQGYERGEKKFKNGKQNFTREGKKSSSRDIKISPNIRGYCQYCIRNFRYKHNSFLCIQRCVGIFVQRFKIEKRDRNSMLMLNFMSNPMVILTMTSSSVCFDYV